MHSKLAAAALLGALATGPGVAPAQAQGNTAPPAVRTDDGRTSGAPVPGSNSFTESQARGRIEDAGFADVADLNKDDQGIWRGRATRNGSPTTVALDFQGNVFGGSAAGSTTGANPGGSRPDGAPGNPPGTAAGRATDRTLGTDTTGANPGGSRPDGAPGNPPGTAASRAADRALGTNATGANATGANPGAGNAPPR